MANSGSQNQSVVHDPGRWGQFKVKLMEEIDRPTALKIAMFYQFPPADECQLKEDDQPGRLCVRMLETKGIIKDTNIEKLLKALNRLNLEGLEEKIRSNFDGDSIKFTKDLQQEHNRDYYQYLDNEMYNAIADEVTRSRMNTINEDNFPKRISNFGLPDNNNLKPSVEGELRIAVVGKTGDGKSATANTILGCKIIEEDVTATSLTATTSRYRSKFIERQIQVVDTPGLQDYHKDRESVLEEISKIPQLIPDGVHAFIFAFNASCPRFTVDDRQALTDLTMVFGKDVTLYSLAVFTRAETVLASMSLTKFIAKQKSAPVFADFLDKIGSNITAVNNASSVPAEVKRNQEAIISLIDNMVQKRKESGNEEVYTNDMFDIAKKGKEEIRKHAEKRGFGQDVFSAVEDAVSSTQSEPFLDTVRRRLPQRYYDDTLDGESEDDTISVRTFEILEEEAGRQQEEHTALLKCLAKYLKALMGKIYQHVQCILL